MKVEFFECDDLLQIEFIAEDIGDAELLLRFATSTKREPADISTSFRKGVSSWCTFLRKDGSTELRNTK